MRSDCLRYLLLSMVGLCVCSMPVSAQRAAAPATGTFNNIFFKNTSGRVGYHMFAPVSVWDADLPTGANATCVPGVYDTTTSGTIPPGLVLLANDLPNRGGVHGFDGTPRQPGDWTVRVVINHIQCTQGANQTDYGPRTVEVHFHIDP